MQTDCLNKHKMKHCSEQSSVICLAVCLCYGSHGAALPSSHELPYVWEFCDASAVTVISSIAHRTPTCSGPLGLQYGGCDTVAPAMLHSQLHPCCVGLFLVHQQSPWLGVLVHRTPTQSGPFSPQYKT